jgi:hypothetical protein
MDVYVLNYYYYYRRQSSRPRRCRSGRLECQSQMRNRILLFRVVSFPKAKQSTLAVPTVWNPPKLFLSIVHFSQWNFCPLSQSPPPTSQRDSLPARPLANPTQSLLHYRSLLRSIASPIVSPKIGSHNSYPRTTITATILEEKTTASHCSVATTHLFEFALSRPGTLFLFGDIFQPNTKHRSSPNDPWIVGLGNPRATLQSRSFLSGKSNRPTPCRISLSNRKRLENFWVLILKGMNRRKIRTTHAILEKDETPPANESSSWGMTTFFVPFFGFQK